MHTWHRHTVNIHLFDKSTIPTVSATSVVATFSPFHLEEKAKVSRGHWWSVVQVVCGRCFLGPLWDGCVCLPHLGPQTLQLNSWERHPAWGMKDKGIDLNNKMWLTSRHEMWYTEWCSNVKIQVWPKKGTRNKNINLSDFCCVWSLSFPHSLTLLFNSVSKFLLNRELYLYFRVLGLWKCF